MQKIEVPIDFVVPSKAPPKRPPSRSMWTAAGVVFVLFCAAILPVYLFALFAWLTLAAIAQAAAKFVRGIGEAVDHAGELITGR